MCSQAAHSSVAAVHSIEMFVQPLQRSSRLNTSNVVYFAQYTKIGRKKLKSSSATEPELGSTAATSPLTQEQLDKIAQNKRAALDRLAATRTPEGFGKSWSNALSSEFERPYFKQVRETRTTSLHFVQVSCLF